MPDGVVNIPLPGRPLDLGGSWDGAAAPCHFLAGPENQLVEVAVRSVVDRQAVVYNPLVLYGPSGTGKSHIARGLASLWSGGKGDRSRRSRVVCTTAVDFARELAEAIEAQAVEEFRTKHRTADLLVFEDLGMLATRKSEKLSAQEELIHTLDALLAEDRWVVVTAAAAPAELPGLMPALQSRLAAGLTIPLAPPGPAARLAVLRQLAAIRDIALPEPVVRLLAENLSGTTPELAGALTELTVSASFDAAPIDLQEVKRFLAEKSGPRQPSLHDIALATARHFGLRLSELKSPERRRALVAARGVAMYLARRWGEKSLEEIGRYFGGRDHTTVMHSCRTTGELVKHDPATHEAIERLRVALWKT